MKKGTRTLRRAAGIAAIVLAGLAAASCDSAAGPGETAVYRTVAFYTGPGGSAVPDAHVRDGHMLARPTGDLAREGYYFAGWSSSAAFFVPFNFDATEITANITLFAAWELRQGGIRFVRNANLQGYEVIGLVDAAAAISLVIPSALNGGRPVVVIANGAFRDSGITGLAFEQGSRLEFIGWDAFNNTASLTGEVTIPASVRQLGGWAFQNSGIAALTFEQGSRLEAIWNMAFANTASLTGTVEIPASVTDIGSNAFWNSGITGLAFGQGSQLESTGLGTFMGTASLTGTVEIPASVATIGGSAFAGSGITGLAFEQGSRLEAIGPSAFLGAATLAGTVEILASVVTIGNDAFFDSGITGLVFAQGSRLEAIGDGAFFGTSSLAGAVEIPASVAIIGEGAFWGSGIEAIRIPHDTLYPPGFSAGEGAWPRPPPWHGNRPVYNSLVSPPERLN